MSPEQQLELFDQLSLFEGADVEYKSARGGLPGSLWETYSAFANSGGGTVWLGVVQRDGELEVQGLEQPEKLKADLWNLLNNREKASCNLLSEGDVRIVPVPHDPGRSLISIHVPRAGRRERPVYVGKDPFSGTYRRNYEGDYRCSHDEVRRMFADQSHESADHRIMEGFGMDDLHAESISQYRNRFASNDPGHPWLGEDDRVLLAKLGGWRRDRQSGREGVTLAGLLMFGREEAIRDAAGVPNFHVDYRERFSDDPAVRWTDRLTLDGRWEGNLFQFYQRVIVKLSTGPGLKSPFRIDAEGYRRAATSVHEALQEALVNSLIHADYAGQGGIVIDRWLDRFEFSNPGTLLLSREQLLRGGVSECRNKALQLMFQKLGAGDKAGSGLDRIRDSWANEYWMSPRLVETYRPDRVLLEMPMVSTLPADVLERLDRRFGPAFRRRDPDEVQALVAAESQGEITNQRLQEMLSLHRVDITRMLRGLVDDGFLVSEGQGRGTRYALVTTEELAPPASPGNPPVLDPSPPDLASSPPVLASSPPVLESRTPENDPELLRIAVRVRAARKTPKQVVRNAILELCRGRYLSIRHLSLLLDRKPESLRESYIRELVRDRLLEPRYPDAPSHPGQAYRTRADDDLGGAQ